MKNIGQYDYDYIISLGFKEDNDPFMGECFNSLEEHDISNILKNGSRNMYIAPVDTADLCEGPQINPIVSKYMIVKSTKYDRQYHVFYNIGHLERLGLVPIEKISKTLKTI